RRAVRGVPAAPVLFAPVQSERALSPRAGSAWPPPRAPRGRDAPAPRSVGGRCERTLALRPARGRAPNRRPGLARAAAVAPSPACSLEPGRAGGALMQDLPPRVARALQKLEPSLRE